MPSFRQLTPCPLEALYLVRIRRSFLNLDGKSCGITVGGDVQDGVGARIRYSHGLVLDLQPGLAQPPHSLHKHGSIISTVII
jgi:hypothetical protein